MPLSPQHSLMLFGEELHFMVYGRINYIQRNNLVYLKICRCMIMAGKIYDYCLVHAEETFKNIGNFFLLCRPFFIFSLKLSLVFNTVCKFGARRSSREEVLRFGTECASLKKRTIQLKGKSYGFR